MSRIGDDTVVTLLKDSVGDAPYLPDRYERIVATASRQRHRRGVQTLGSLSLGLALVGGIVVVNGRGVVLGDPVTVLTSAAGRAEEVGTARMAGSMTIETMGSTTTTSLDGAIDFRSGRSRLTTTSGAAGTAEVITDGTTIYTALPQTTPGAVGKRWLRSDISSLAGSPTAVDPRSMFSALTAVSSDVRERGRETVRGVRTTQYTFVLDTKKAELGAVFENTDVAYDAWVDDDGLVRRLRSAADLSTSLASFGLPSGGSSSFSMTFEFFDYGAPVRIDLPAANEIVDLKDALGSSAGLQACIRSKTQQLVLDLAATMKSGETPDLNKVTALIEKATAECRAAQ